VQCPDFYSDIELKFYALFNYFYNFLSVQVFNVQKGLQHLDTGFGHALSEQVLDICMEKGSQMSKVHVEHSRLYACLLFNLLLSVYQDGKLIVRTEKGAMRDVKRCSRVIETFLTPVSTLLEW
jgi:hypothetical protein